MSEFKKTSELKSESKMEPLPNNDIKRIAKIAFFMILLFLALIALNKYVYF